MSISSRIECSSEDAKESALVAERTLRHGLMPDRIRTIQHSSLAMGLKADRAMRIVQKGEALAERLRGTAIERAVLNGDVSTAVSLIALQSDIDRLANCAQSNLPCVPLNPEDVVPHPSVFYLLSSVLAVPLFFISPPAAIISFCACLGLCYIGKWVFVSRSLERERNRWNEIVRDVPELTYPNEPVFSESQYRIRGMNYEQWLDDFKAWSHSSCSGLCGSRITTGKKYASEDRQWHRFFDEWQRDVFAPTVKQMNAEMKIKSNTRREQLRKEYIRRFQSIPHESNIPEHFHEIHEHTSITKCYVREHWRNRRNMNV